MAESWRIAGLSGIILCEIFAGLVAAWWSKVTFVEESDAYVLLNEQTTTRGGLAQVTTTIIMMDDGGDG